MAARGSGALLLGLCASAHALVPAVNQLLQPESVPVVADATQLSSRSAHHTHSSTSSDSHGYDAEAAAVHNDTTVSPD